MLSSTHLKLCVMIEKIMKRKYNIDLNKKSLVYGSIKPDFVKNKVPHYIDNSIDYICEEIEYLIYNCRQIGAKEFSRRLGMIIHYVCDYFCIAHNVEYYRCNIFEHLKYENQLARIITRKKLRGTTFGDFNFNEVKKFILELNSEYMEKKSMDRDLEYTCKAINGVCDYIAIRII